MNNSEPTLTRFYSAAEVARILGVSPRWAGVLAKRCGIALRRGRSKDITVGEARAIELAVWEAHVRGKGRVAIE